MAKRDQESRVNDFTLSPEAADEEESVKEAGEAFAKLYRQGAEGDFPTTLAAARKRHTWVILISTLGLLLVVALGVLFFLGNGGGKFGEEAVSLTLVGPQEAPSGQVVEYTLAYHNDQGVDLTDIEVNLRYPEGFTFEGSLPQADNTEGTRLTLKRIRARESGNLSVRGLLVGEVGDVKQFSAVVTYEPENISAQYAKTLNVATQVVASVLNLELTGPAQLPEAEPLSLSATYRNSSAEPLSGLVVRFTSPGGFELELPQLTPLSGAGNTWLLPDLEPLAEGKVEFKGRFTEASAAGKQEIRVAVGLLGEGNKVTVQEEKVHELTLVKSHLTLNLTANDVSLKSAVDLGQQLTYQVTVANEGELPFTNIILVARLDTTYLDWSTLRDDAGGTVNRTEGTITWTKEVLPFLAALQPGSRTTVRWYISVVPSLPAGASATPSFKAKVEAQAGQMVGESLQAIMSESNEVESKFNTRLTLEADGRYYTDDLVKLGSGPLPPQVGQTTTYVIFWRLANNLSEVENVEVTTTLPPEVNFTGQSTVAAGSPVSFNPNTREVRWTLNRLPAGAGTGFARPEASFEVAVTPGPSDANKILVLTRTTTVTARDTFSGADLIATAKFITTELDNDLGAQGKGIVVP
ncbi:MAG: hypothetical protein U1C53_02885 [Candidatus Veblenbacteria bacterium]|nr:hypothetical protein [Candidatus Veblenbacteria bacterium]MDZ4230060.1 hypothetical protein [Candidatus Veblenbacteria bacterium]